MAYYHWLKTVKILLYADDNTTLYSDMIPEVISQTLGEEQAVNG